jgi:hypothetical protein
MLSFNDVIIEYNENIMYYRAQWLIEELKGEESYDNETMCLILYFRGIFIKIYATKLINIHIYDHICMNINAYGEVMLYIWNYIVALLHHTH